MKMHGSYDSVGNQRGGVAGQVDKHTERHIFAEPICY